MRKIIAMLGIMILAGCAPSPEAIQIAIEQTQAAMITNTPEIPTLTATLKPTKTPIPTKTSMPTWTPTPAPNYILETGFCVLGVKNVQGDPSGVPGCGLSERKQMYLASNQSVTVTFSGNITDRQNYCALFKLDGTFIMASLDTTASGKVTCEP